MSLTHVDPPRPKKGPEDHHLFLGEAGLWLVFLPGPFGALGPFATQDEARDAQADWWGQPHAVSAQMLREYPELFDYIPSEAFVAFPPSTEPPMYNTSYPGQPPVAAVSRPPVEDTPPISQLLSALSQLLDTGENALHRVRVLDSHITGVPVASATDEAKPGLGSGVTRDLRLLVQRAERLVHGLHDTVSHIEGAL